MLDLLGLVQDMDSHTPGSVKAPVHVISMAKPRVSLPVDGKDTSFLIGMGATCSALLEFLGLSLPYSISVVGVDSVLSQLKATLLLSCSLGDPVFSHSFLVLP